MQPYESARVYAPARPFPARGPVMMLTVAALIASLVALVSYMMALSREVNPGQFFAPNLTKDPIYYAAHAAEILLLLAAGLLALRSTGPRTIESGFLLRLGLFFASALLMTVRGYSMDELLSTKLADATGPFACLISVAIFIGARRANWEVLDKALLALAGVLSALVLYGVAGLQSASRPEAVSNLNPAVNALFWPASWFLLRETGPRSPLRLLRFAPIGVYGLASVFTETRLNFVMLFALLLLSAYLDYRRGVRQAVRWVVATGLGLWLVLLVAVFLSDTAAVAKLRTAGESFYSRMEQDTRTGQLRWFFRSVEPHELVLGRGSLATWYWGPVAYNGMTDIGYLSLIFYGGVPLLVTYVAVHMAPAFGVLRRKRSSGLQLAAAGVVLLWALRMCSSSYPGLTLDYYPILLCVGACVSREPER